MCAKQFLKELEEKAGYIPSNLMGLFAGFKRRASQKEDKNEKRRNE